MAPSLDRSGGDRTGVIWLVLAHARNQWNVVEPQRDSDGRSFRAHRSLRVVPRKGGGLPARVVQRRALHRPVATRRGRARVVLLHGNGSLLSAHFWRGTNSSVFPRRYDRASTRLHLSLRIFSYAVYRFN